MNVIRSHCHEIYTEEINKIALSSDDDKRVIMANGINSLAYRHTNLKKLLLEIIDAAKKLSLYGFRGVFSRDTLPKKAKLNECGILNLDSSSGDGTHWVMSFEKGKNKLYFDSYGVQPPSELIAYLKSSIFYSSERVQ